MRSITSTRGSTLRFRLGKVAWLRIDVRRGNTATPTATLTRRAAAGAGRLKFTGRLGRVPLRPGHYRLRIVAVDAAGNRSAARTVRFAIVRR